MSSAHLTDDQISRYGSRTLAPADLLALDGHIAECEDCRGRLAQAGNAWREAARLRADLDGHLDYHATVACAEGGGTPEQRRHLEECAMCRDEVEDLRGFREQLGHGRVVNFPAPRKRRWPWLAAAAAIALAAGLGVWTTRHGAAPAPPVAAVQPPPSPAVSPAKPEFERAPAFERAPILDRLISHPGTLLGPSGGGRWFELLAPVGTAVSTDRPLFRWRPLEPGATYVVEIFDEHFNPLLESPRLRTAEWQPDRPLPRGRVLEWQVTAHMGTESVMAPLPPAPEARLEILPAAAAEAIESARREHAGDHLLLAALYTNAGALDEAEAELRQVDEGTARPYLEKLRQLRAAR